MKERGILYRKSEVVKDFEVDSIVLKKTSRKSNRNQLSKCKRSIQVNCLK